MILDGEKEDLISFGTTGIFRKPFTKVTGATFTPEGFVEKRKRYRKYQSMIHLQNIRNKQFTENWNKQFKGSDFIKQGIWIDLFPLFLKVPGDFPIKFKYVGKADVNGKRANVLELFSLGKTPGGAKESKAQVKLFFDEESDLLLLITQKSSLDSETWETKYYFSNYEVIDGLKVAKKLVSSRIYLQKMGMRKSRQKLLLRNWK